MAAKRKKQKAVKNKIVQPPVKIETNKFLIQVVIYLVIFLFTDFLTIYYFTVIIPKQTNNNRVISADAYKNPEFEKLKNLPIGGMVEKKMPVFDKLKFVMSKEAVFSGTNPVFSLNICCLFGVSKEYYTAKMPWAFIMYDFEEGLATTVLFEIDSKKKIGRFEIVILDPKADVQKLRAVSVRIFAELLKEYKPEYTWRGSVRQEIN